MQGVKAPYCRWVGGLAGEGAGPSVGGWVGRAAGGTTRSEWAWGGEGGGTGVGWQECRMRMGDRQAGAREGMAHRQRLAASTVMSQLCPAWQGQALLAARVPPHCGS